MPTRRDPGLAAAAEHDLRAAEPDRVRAVADRHLRRGTGRALRARAAPSCPSSIETQPAPLFGMIAATENGLTRSAPRSSSVSIAVLVGLETAHPGADRDTDPLGLVRDLEAGVGLRLTRGRHDHLREPIQPPDLLALEPRVPDRTPSARTRTAPDTQTRRTP